MLKGINKQIIEIKCPNDEFFEKALLFVRADKAELSAGELEQHARVSIAQSIGYRDEARRGGRRLSTVLLWVMLGALVVSGAVLFYLG